MKKSRSHFLLHCFFAMILFCVGIACQSKPVNTAFFTFKPDSLPYKTVSSVLPEAVSLGTRLELMIDDQLLDKFTNAGLRLHHPERREVVMEYDKPWEGNGCSFRTVFQDGEIYRMYYTSWHIANEERPGHPIVISYAESRDGIHWDRPNLGLHAFGGSKDNNIVVAEINGAEMLDFSVFKDDNPNASADARYKAVGLGRNPRGIYVFQSPDGIHWRPIRNTPVIPDKHLGLKNVGDSQNIIFWDPNQKHYRMYFRGMHDGSIRDIMTTTSPDLIHWSDPAWLHYPDAPQEQLYHNVVKPYYRAPHIYIGFPARYSDRGPTASTWQLPEPDLRKQRAKQSPRYATAVTDALLMVSRDGKAFYRWPEAFIRPGLRVSDNWSYGDNYVAWHVVETTSTFDDASRELSLYATESYFTGKSSRLRRFTIRIDGFASAYASIEGGEVLTKPITFSGNGLMLNYATSGGGSLCVELLDVQGKVLPGFALEACDIIFGDQLARLVTWKGNSDVSVLAGVPVRLRFFLADADLYSFQFVQGK